MKKFLVWLVSSPVSAVIGIVGLLLGVYTGFFYERKPDLSISVDSLSKVFDLYRPVGGLEVSYGGENLRSSKRNLWVLTATIKNRGNAEIRKGDYDDKVPLGLEVTGATVAEPPTLKTNVAYLERNLTVTTESTRLLFSPVILESDDSFEVTALLLGSESAKPKIVPIGKLAGVKAISFTTPESPSPEKSNFRQAVEGSSAWVHLIRLFIYFIATVLLFLMTGLLVVAASTPFDSLKERKQANERLTQIATYRRHEELTKEARFLIDQYVTAGPRGLAPVARYLSTYKRRRALLDALDRQLDEKTRGDLVRTSAPQSRRNEAVEEMLKDARLLDGEGLDARPSDKLDDAFSDLCRFLEIDPERFLMRMVGPDGLEVDDVVVAYGASGTTFKTDGASKPK